MRLTSDSPANRFEEFLQVIEFGHTICTMLIAQNRMICQDLLKSFL